MKICPKCLSVYLSVYDIYCRQDGKKLIDTVFKEAEPLIERLRIKIKGE